LPFETLTEGKGADFDALAGRILPADSTPGAREACDDTSQSRR
jgi:hypothetical protein